MPIYCFPMFYIEQQFGSMEDYHPIEESDFLGNKKSRDSYEKEYKLFSAWCIDNHHEKITENAILAYFKEKSEYLKYSSLATKFCMLKTMLSAMNNIDISRYNYLLEFMKESKRDLVVSKRTEIFSRDQMNLFIRDAPDKVYLMTKVALIFGVAGSMRRTELCNVTLDDIEDSGSVVSFKINDSDSHTTRVARITDEGEESLNYANYYRKYAALRPPQTNHRRFFINYKDGKCYTLPVGVNTFGKVPFVVAKFLNLPNLGGYNGHCFKSTCKSLSTSVHGQPLSSFSSVFGALEEHDPIIEESDFLKNIKSRDSYEKEYRSFSAWCIEKNHEKITENVVLSYFKEKSKTLKSTSLNTKFCILKTMLSAMNDIDITKYSYLLEFIKESKRSQAFVKRTEILSMDQLNVFIRDAPDKVYLMAKVALIFGVAGSMRRAELYNVTIDDIEDSGSVVSFKIKDSDSHTTRVARITDEGEESLNYANYYRKYAALRPEHTIHRRFFINYKDGKCSTLAVGINAFGKVPFVVAKFLNLPNPEAYNGYCFQRTCKSLSSSELRPRLSSFSSVFGMHE